MGLQNYPAASHRSHSMSIHHISLDASHPNQTVFHREVIPETLRQERTVAGILNVMRLPTA